MILSVIASLASVDVLALPRSLTLVARSRLAASRSSLLFHFRQKRSCSKYSLSSYSVNRPAADSRRHFTFLFFLLPVSAWQNGN